MFKHELGQTVFFMDFNKVCVTKILARTYRDDFLENQNILVRIEYKTTYGTYPADKFFSSKEELLASL